MSKKLLQNEHLRIFLAVATTAGLPIYALAILGCFSTSSGIPNIWMAEITSPSLSGVLVHAGYFCICLVTNRTTLCGNSAHAIPDKLAVQFNAAQVETLLEIALTLQQKIILYFIVVGAVFYTIGAFIATLQHYSRKTAQFQKLKRTLLLYHASIIPFLAAFAFTLVASLTNTQTINALQSITQLDGATVHFKTGRVLEVLQWLLVALVALVCLGTWVLKKKDHMGHFAFMTGAPTGQVMSAGLETMPSAPPMLGPAGMPPPMV